MEPQRYRVLHLVLWVLALVLCRCAGNAFMEHVHFGYFMLAVLAIWLTMLVYNSTKTRDEDRP